MANPGKCLAAILATMTLATVLYVATTVLLGFSAWGLAAFLVALSVLAALLIPLAYPLVPEITFHGDSLEVRGPFVRKNIPYAAIEGLEFREFDYGFRFYGYVSLRTMGGRFVTPEFGRYNLAGHPGSKRFILIWHAGELLALSLASEAETAVAFDEISGRSRYHSSKIPVKKTVAPPSGKKVGFFALALCAVVCAAATIPLVVDDGGHGTRTFQIIVLPIAVSLAFATVYALWQRKRGMGLGRLGRAVGGFVLIGTVTMAVALVVTIVMMATSGGIVVDMNANGFSVKAPYVSEDVQYDDVVSVEMASGLSFSRVSGLDGVGISSGDYQSPTLGKVKLAIHLSVGSYIVVERSNGVPLVFNLETQEFTEACLSELLSHIGP